MATENTVGARGFAASTALAERINRYWKARGVKANARVVSEVVGRNHNGPSDGALVIAHGVRSDLTGKERG